ncbi:hypothetical protein D477_019888 [Arthrobacter crystallopoietes BAB-32]|uniref:Uncharacterized protein n=1 Tax=Arthrobacter crystallopoietes BAB-32 TaxID=1246476 RepID=N1UXC7_9MICC|nr:hypothetical protein [Arthrobacter crystallopoietes]EMY32492.1 hypothetical protein D477_019888 [Arthrobacter crystallopoietes BAB-32]
MEASVMEAARLAKAHGLFNLVFGIWPLLHYRSFEAVTGPKSEPWLVKTVGALMAGIGYTQLRAGGSHAGLNAAGRLGVATSAAFAVIDAVYGGRDRISRIYLLDAVAEAAWVLAWLRARNGLR